MFFKLFTDHPVHAPSNEGDPWECESPPPSNYIIKCKLGVFQVYENDDAAASDKPLNYDYPDLASFVSDMNKLNTMIADGPL